MKSLTAPELRRLVRTLHRILRDCEGNSSLVERFDELTKLLYCKVLDERTAAGAAGEGVFAAGGGEDDGRVAARLHGLLRGLVRDNAALFPERFSRFRLSDAALRRAAAALAPVRLSAAAEDLKGLAYEEVIRNTFDKGDNQQFFTPRPVVEFMVQMLDWSRPGVVCDPACGTGGFLLYVDRFVRQLGERPRGPLLGFEVDERLAWVAGINLAMHGVGGFAVRHLGGAGALGKEVRPYFGRVDAIVTNPPFGSDLTDREALAEFELGRGRASRRRGVLFIERCLDLLKPGGTLAIILDDGVLNGPSNRDVRRLLLERSHPLAVVGLPETAFLPYASVRSSILFLRKKGGRKGRAAPGRETFFARAEAVGRRPNGDPLLRVNPSTGAVELDSDLPDILRQWQDARAAPEGRAFRARVPDAEDAAFARDGCRLDPAYHHPARRAALSALRSSPYPVKALFEVCAVRNETVAPARDLPEDELTYLGLANIEAHTGACAPVVVPGSSLKSVVRRFAAGDVLFARMRPELRKVCLVPDGIAEGFVSAECLVLMPRPGWGDGRPVMLPELLALLLRSDLVYGQVVHLVIGTGRPRLSRPAVLNVRLPCPPPAEQRRLLEAYRQAEREAQALLRESARVAAKARQVGAEAVRRLVHDIFPRCR